MKALVAAIVLLSSSIVFAQVAPAMTQEEAAGTLIVSCSIEKFCAAGTESPVDLAIKSQKDVASLQLGATCADIDAMLTTPDILTALNEVATNITTSGGTTCLSTSLPAAPAVTTPAPEVTVTP